VMSPWLQYPIALVVACHGFIYAYLLFVPDTLNGWRGISYLLGSTLTGDRLMALHVGAGILILASGGGRGLRGVGSGLVPAGDRRGRAGACRLRRVLGWSGPARGRGGRHRRGPQPGAAWGAIAFPRAFG
jgi:hypothetical protein